MTRITGKGVAGEAEPRLHGATEQQLLQGEVTERGLSSSPSRDEDETRRVFSPRNHSVASAGDSALFQSSVSLSLSSSSSLRSDVESYYGDGMYPQTACEWEEIPSFRWIASPLRWWKPRKGSSVSKMNSAVDARAADRRVGAGAAVGEMKMLPTSAIRDGHLHFYGHPIFEVEDLLMAEEDLLGRDTFGSVYKAIFKNGYEVAIRRLKWAKALKDFKAEADMLGRIRHPNLMELTAFYYSSQQGGDNLLLYEYMPTGSLSDFLHGQRPQLPIDWLTRMKIAVGTARGLHHLHTQVNMIHGNLSSRNILLDYGFDAKIADYGLSKLLTTTKGSNTPGTDWESGHHAPELSELKKANTKTDVYSLGVIMLELLTGKSPTDQDFQWIESDRNVEMTPRPRGDFRSTLNLALECVKFYPYARPDVQEVLQRLEEIESTSARNLGAITVKKRNKATKKRNKALMMLKVLQVPQLLRS